MIVKVDNREHVFINHMKLRINNTSVFPTTKITFIPEQLIVGDYIITDDSDKILAIIERKTITDYEQTLRDSRQNNMKELVKICDSKNIDLYLIVEDQQDKYGNYTHKYTELAFNSLHNKSYNNITAENTNRVVTSINNFIIRDNVRVIHTNGIDDTALRISVLALSYFKLINNDVIVGGGITGNETSVNLLDDIKTSKKNSDGQIAANILKSLPYITDKVITQLTKHTLYDLFNIDDLIEQCDISNCAKETLIRMRKCIRGDNGKDIEYETKLRHALCTMNLITTKLLSEKTFNDKAYFRSTPINTKSSKHLALIRIIQHATLM
jgi:ERCC4-type nuclease